MNRRLLLQMVSGVPLAWMALRGNSATGELVIVHKSEGCICCEAWVKHLQGAGFTVRVIEESNLGPIKEQVGVPVGKGSCHTAEVQGYFLEGHVPASDLQRLLRERPKAKGLVVPGMPPGSPGMEVPSGRFAAYEVLLVALDGTTTVFAKHGGN